MGAEKTVPGFSPVPADAAIRFDDLRLFLGRLDFEKRVRGSQVEEKINLQGLERT